MAAAQRIAAEVSELDITETEVADTAGDRLGLVLIAKFLVTTGGLTSKRHSAQGL